ncbi:MULTISPECIES: hypothetical protein [unclassified Archaeoglobus]|jgi:hypothetical protein|uniref:hypothetical protein n=1 Tax=unclassified Archaeoglobus TaxID=2643606 RepID=UPI0025C275AB|nr:MULTISPECIES: hypothetical protein [unclassified Archaeoglobus]
MWRGTDVEISEYISLNTFILTPELVEEYLKNVGILASSKRTEEEITLSDRSVFEDFLTTLKEIMEIEDVKVKETRLREFLNDKDNIDITLTVGLSSYELFGRLLILLEYKFRNGKIRDEELNTLLKNCLIKRRKLPGDSKGIKNLLNDTNFLKLCSYLLSKIILGNFHDFYKNNILDGDEHDYIAQAIKVRYEESIEKLKLLLKIYNPNDETISSKVYSLFQELYILSSKGRTKAYEGYNYEDVLKRVLEKEGFHLHLEGTKEEDVDEDLKDMRKWDIYIPNKENPCAVIEVMYMLTTSSGQTNKRKAIVEEVNKHKNIHIYVLMDGVGWIARWSDARELLKCGAGVFTFHKDSIKAFIEDLREKCGKFCDG